MNVTKILETQAKIDKEINANGDAINEAANGVLQFIDENAIKRVLAESLKSLYADQAIELALDSSVIQDAISDLCFDFAGRVIAGDQLLKGE